MSAREFLGLKTEHDALVYLIGIWLGYNQECPPERTLEAVKLLDIKSKVNIKGSTLYIEEVK